MTERTLLIMSQGCQQIRTQLLAEYALETRLQNMKLRNPDKKDSFQYSLGFIYHNTTELEHALKRTLDCCFSMQFSSYFSRFGSLNNKVQFC